MKVIKSNDNINSFGGLNFISNEFDSLGIRQIITTYFVKHSKISIYKYHDIIKNSWTLAKC